MRKEPEEVGDVLFEGGSEDADGVVGVIAGTVAHEKILWIGARREGARRFFDRK